MSGLMMLGLLLLFMVLTIVITYYGYDYLKNPLKLFIMAFKDGKITSEEFDEIVACIENIKIKR